MSSPDDEEIIVQPKTSPKLDCDGLINWEPQIGMEFDSIEEVGKLYHRYSVKNEFGMRIRGTKKVDDVVKNRIFCCSRQGFRTSDKRYESVAKPRPETRCGCNAHMSVKILKNGKYQIYSFDPVHNHGVVSPTNVQFLRSRKHLSESQAVEADIASSSGMAVPQIGMEFDSIEEVGKLYHRYSAKIGFCVRIKGSKKVDDVVKNKIFCCSRQGFRTSDKRYESVVKPRPETRCGCDAHMSVKILKNGKYQIYSFEPVHNHSVVSPTKVQFLRSHGYLSESQAVEAEIASSSGMAPKEDMVVDYRRSPPVVDPKLEFSNRYKNLCLMLVQVASKAALTEETSTIVAEHSIKMTKEVDEVLKKIHINKPSQVESDQGEYVDSLKTSNVGVNQYDEDNMASSDANIRGIKQKVITGGGSKRFKRSLEKAAKRTVGNKKNDERRSKTKDTSTTSHSQTQVAYQPNLLSPPSVYTTALNRLPKIAPRLHNFTQMGSIRPPTLNQNFQWLPFTNLSSGASQMHHFMNPTSLPSRNIETGSQNAALMHVQRESVSSTPIEPSEPRVEHRCRN